MIYIFWDEREDAFAQPKNSRMWEPRRDHWSSLGKHVSSSAWGMGLIWDLNILQGSVVELGLELSPPGSCPDPCFWPARVLLCLLKELKPVKCLLWQIRSGVVCLHSIWLVCVHFIGRLLNYIDELYNWLCLCRETCDNFWMCWLSSWGRCRRRQAHFPGSYRGDKYKGIGGWWWAGGKVDFKSGHQMLGRILNGMISPKGLQAKGCEQTDVGLCLVYFFFMISTGDQKKDRGP